jgi:hypothetical protein
MGRLCLEVFQFPDQPSVYEVCRFLNFSFQSSITPHTTRVKGLILTMGPRSLMVIVNRNHFGTPKFTQSTPPWKKHWTDFISIPWLFRKKSPENLRYQKTWTTNLKNTKNLSCREGRWTCFCSLHTSSYVSSEFCTFRCLVGDVCQRYGPLVHNVVRNPWTSLKLWFPMPLFVRSTVCVTPLVYGMWVVEVDGLPNSWSSWLWIPLYLCTNSLFKKEKLEKSDLLNDSVNLKNLFII